MQTNLGGTRVYESGLPLAKSSPKVRLPALDEEPSGMSGHA
jgi:hypothetical protein